MDIKDPLRRAPASFSEWLDTFTIEDEDERLRLSVAADALRSNPVFVRVVNHLEAISLKAIHDCPVGNRDLLFDAKVLLDAVRNIRGRVNALAEDKTLAESRSKKADGFARIPDK